MYSQMLRLLESTDHQSAKEFIQTEQAYLKLVEKESVKSSNAGLEYLKYIEKSWMPEELWSGWLMFRRKKAAARLGKPISGILPTTNHLKSFNGVLKNKYLPQWQHSGHHLCFDVLIFHLVSSILPRLFAQI